MADSSRFGVLKPLLLCTFLCLAVGSLSQTRNAQVSDEQEKQVSIPVATRWTLDAAGPVQQAEIKSVILLICPITHMKGSGFLIDSGLIVTNNHVLTGCDAEQMEGLTSEGATVGFTKAVVDNTVDLALLKPSRPMTGGLKLAVEDKPAVGTSLSTWGYPLSFNGPAPILSTAILAGFTEDGIGEKRVKHLILNGAINPGNSGGPLFRNNDDKVIGIVVAKFLPYDPEVQRLITLLASNSKSMLKGEGSGNFVGKDARGNVITITQSMVTAAILQAFYNGTQVSLGEAISVSELKALLTSSKSELR